MRFHEDYDISRLSSCMSFKPSTSVCSRQTSPLLGAPSPLLWSTGARASRIGFASTRPLGRSGRDVVWPLRALEPSLAHLGITVGREDLEARLCGEVGLLLNDLRSQTPTAPSPSTVAPLPAAPPASAHKEPAPTPAPPPPPAPLMPRSAARGGTQSPPEHASLEAWQSRGD